MASFVVGVDGGTTKTIALVADEEGRILAAARGKGSNWSGADVEIPMSTVVATVGEALSGADLAGDDVTLAMLTLAGADWLEDHERRHAYLSAQGIARRVAVKNDSFGGLRAGTSQPYGVVVAAGTGSTRPPSRPTAASGPLATMPSTAAPGRSSRRRPGRYCGPTTDAENPRL